MGLRDIPYSAETLVIPFEPGDARLTGSHVSWDTRSSIHQPGRIQGQLTTERTRVVFAGHDFFVITWQEKILDRGIVFHIQLLAAIGLEDNGDPKRGSSDFVRRGAEKPRDVYWIQHQAAKGSWV